MEKNSIEEKSTKTKLFPKWPYSDKREKELLAEVLESGNWWRMSGNMVTAFEGKFAAIHQVKHCLCVTNGTHAIELALTALGIGRGDEVIVPAVTFISTASAVIACNATPVLVDIDPEEFCMSPEAIERAITPRTKAVIPVHMAGHPCDMISICAIAKKYNIRVIEDAAHAHGGMCSGKSIGSYGDMAIFSFQNGKIMTCGEGGALITNSDELYNRAYLIHGVGRPKGDRVYEHTVMGSNYRMNEFQGAVLIAQLERLEFMNRRREENAARMNELLKDIPGIFPQGRKPYAELVTHYMFMFYYDPSSFGGLSRSDFVDALNQEGIPAFICFPVLSDTTFFKNGDFNGRISVYNKEKEADLTNARKIANEVVWLPHYTMLGGEEELQEIRAAILKIQKRQNI